ncbi:MarR family transcriptional regulator [bacterium]|nr:MarR family transcriptional regulator [bacterium]
MAQYDFQASIGYWITVTSFGYQRVLEAELAEFGITFRQFQVLGWLKLAGTLSQVELAERMAIEPPTLVRILDRMESAGWILRGGDPSDRRRKLISVQPEAEPAWSQVVRVLKRVRNRATRDMSPDEVDLLQNLLQRVQVNLGMDVPVAV